MIALRVPGRVTIYHLLSVLRLRVPHHLVCNLSGCERFEISHGEAGLLVAHGRLLCPCGGSLLSKYRRGGVVR